MKTILMIMSFIHFILAGAPIGLMVEHYQFNIGMIAISLGFIALAIGYLWGAYVKKAEAEAED